ncbi:hypothetical protein [Microbacterium sp. che218]|uniref:hypothetical protein n=1 Tax=Microbacterium sp. che218 TaxID=3140649 RepID=UPI0033664794
MSIENFPRRIRALTHFTAPDGGWSGYLARPGDVLDITPRMYEQTQDDTGASWLDFSPEEQTALYGTPRFEEIEETS